MIGKVIRSRTFLITMSVLLLIAALFAYKLSQPDPVNKDNFRAIALGMSRQELETLFGEPQTENVEIGIVNDPRSYSTNRAHSVETLRSMGYDDYTRLQWNSREITIVVILDKQNQAVCRYDAEGQPASSRFRLPFGLHIPFLGI